MKKKKRRSLKHILLFLPPIICFMFPVHAQQTLTQGMTDSLMQKSYQELENTYLELMHKDVVKAAFYIDIQIKKAKQEQDTLKLVEGYSNMSFVYNTRDKGIVYSDSIIDFTKNWNHPNYPTYGYILKATCKYNLGKYREALEIYLYALSIVDKENKKYVRGIKNGISALKHVSGQYKEALDLDREILMDITSQEAYRTNLYIDYMNALFNIAVSYMHSKQEKEAERYCRIGMEEALRADDSVWYHEFYAILGEVKYRQGNYDRSIEILTESLEHNSDYDLASVHVLRGRSYWEKGNRDSAIADFEKADSLVQLIQDFPPEIMEAYALLSKYYEKEHNLEKQLEYVNKLIYVDSLLDSETQFLSTEIKNKYDLPLVWEERKHIIEALEHKNNCVFNWIYGLSIALILSLLFGFYYVRKQRVDKKRFEVVMATQRTLARNPSLDDMAVRKTDIAQDVVDHILEGLTNFESNKDYLNSEVTLQNLSKSLETNSNYLSKVINSYYHKNFSSYVSDLRVEHTLDRLQQDARFRQYTIKAIASEVGFRNAETFTKAFYKKTSLYPSYFIKQLNRE